MAQQAELFLNQLPDDLQVDTSESALEMASSDVFAIASFPPLAILLPTDVQHVCAIWEAANEHVIPVISRGAGLSYTGSVLPAGPNTAILDTRRLNKIDHIDQGDRYIRVQSGVSWQQIDQALEGTSLRLKLVPPISGSLSTVGGALAQGLPMGLESIIGIDVVTPTGQSLQVGAGQFGSSLAGVNRTMGADLLGIFLGSGGIFGTIVSATFRLEPVPPCSAYRTYRTTHLQAAAHLAGELGGGLEQLRIFATPVHHERTMADIGWRDKLALGWRLLRRPKGLISLFSALRAWLSTLKGADAQAQLPVALHVIIEGQSEQEVSRVCAALDDAAHDDGALRVSSPAPSVMHQSPYSLRGMLGPMGERWVPVHGIGAASMLQPLAQVTAEFFDRHANSLEAHEITTSWLLMLWPGQCALIEPMFLWPAPLLPVHKLAGSAATRAMEDWSAEASSSTELVRQLREELIAKLDASGAIHLQIGKTYPYRTRLDTAMDALLVAIKNELDPKGIAAPGNLGFAS